MELDTVIARWDRPLAGHLRRLVGSDDLAEDLRQELWLRAWRHAPRDADEHRLRAWLYRTASNLAVDALRRRKVRRWEELPDALPVSDADASERLAVQAALDQLAPADRLVLWLAQAGYSRREIGELLDIAPEAARKRVARARRRLAAAWRETTRGRRPRVALAHFDTDPEPYRRWLESFGIDVLPVPAGPQLEPLVGIDGLVLAGSERDVHPASYGDRPRAAHAPDLATDRAELRLVRRALDLDLPVLGICRGHQLLNVAHGGTLWQDVTEQAAEPSHRGHDHVIATAGGTRGRALLGREAVVPSGHHQSVRRLGRGLMAAAMSADGVVEMIEQPARRFAVGVQWHPEDASASEPTRRLGEAFAEALERVS